jgi:hypothetical protein
MKTDLNPASLELHDAILQSIHFDLERSSLRLVAHAYVNLDSTRKKIEIEFSNVLEYSLIADVISLSDNGRAGNVNYWAPAVGSGNSIVYLNDGCIRVNAGGIRCCLL